MNFYSYLTSYPHPYEYELNHLEFPEDKLKVAQLQMYKSLEQTPFTWVDDANKLQVLLSKLEKAKEIAIDLEVYIYHICTFIIIILFLASRFPIISRFHVFDANFNARRRFHC